MLKPFTSVVKRMFCFLLHKSLNKYNNCRTVRTSSALALGKLSALSTRVDPLVNDLLSTLQVLLVCTLYN